MRDRRPRRWNAATEDDPVAGLINLFDLWMVFSIALLLALVSYFRLPELLSGESVTLDKNPGTSPMEIIRRDRVKLEHYRVSDEQLTGEGERLGTAYRLKSGEVVYVPESLGP